MMNTNTKLRFSGVKAALTGLAVLGAAATSSQAKEGPTLETVSEDKEYFVEIQQVFVKPDMQNGRAFNAEIGPPRDLDFDYGRDSSSRLIVGFMKPTTGMGYRARYWSFDDNTTEVGNDSNGLITTDAISIVAGGGVDDVDAVAVTHSMDTDVLDLEAIKQLGTNNNIIGSLGVRIARFDQEYIAGTDEGTLSSELDFLGLGPTASIEGEYPIGESNFTLFGNARLSALVGRRELNSNNIDTVNNGAALVSGTDTEIVIIGDLQAGVEWRPEAFQDAGFFTRAGLEYQRWANIGNLRDISSPAIDDTLPAGVTSSASHYDGDIDFLGFFLSAGFEF